MTVTFSPAEDHYLGEVHRCKGCGTYRIATIPGERRLNPNTVGPAELHHFLDEVEYRARAAASEKAGQQRGR